MSESKQSKLTTWVNQYEDELSIELFHNDLHSSLKNATSLAFYRTTMNYKGRSFGGNGSSTQAEHALLKSIVETIERAAAIGHLQLKDSNGKACHFEPQLAIDAAKLELIERDAFFSHFLTLTPFLSAPTHPNLNQTISRLAKNNIEVNFYSMQSISSKIETVICKLSMQFDNTKRYIIAAAAAAEVCQAQEKCLNEALSLTNTLQHKKTQLNITEQDIKKLDSEGKFSPWDHIRLYFNDEYAKWFEDMFFVNSTNTAFPVLDLACDIRVEISNLQDSVFKGSGLTLAVADSPSIQQAFWGYPKPEQINFERLKLLRPSISHNEIPWNSLHLFG